MPVGKPCHHTGGKVNGRSLFLRGRHEAHHSLHACEPLAALGTVVDMPTGVCFIWMAFTIENQVDYLSGLSAVHASTTTPSSFRLSISRAIWRSDFTVPSGRPSARLISLILIPPKWNMTRDERYFSGKRDTAS